MHFEPHAVVGWTIGNVAGADRQLRLWCVVGAILPDINTLPIVFGPQAYAHAHHTFGHNVFLWALFVGAVTFKCRSKCALFLSYLCFEERLLFVRFASARATRSAPYVGVRCALRTHPSKEA